MTREEVMNKVTETIRECFDNEDIIVSEATVAADVEGWDSLMHITLIENIEDAFNIRFAMKDVVGMKNVGEMVDLILGFER